MAFFVTRFLRRLQPSVDCLLLAEAGSKLKITSAGGQYDLRFEWHVTQVGLEILSADDSLPMSRAVPTATKSRLF